MTSPSQDQDLRTALELARDTLEGIARDVSACEWLTDYEISPLPQIYAALTPAQAPDKAGEREGLAKAWMDERKRFILSSHGFSNAPAKLYKDEKTNPEPIHVGTIDECDQIVELACADAALTYLAALAPQPNGTEASRGERVTLDYTNYRGERATRTITPWSIEWGSTDWHPEPGWLLTCYDHDKHACRTYALSGIHPHAGLAFNMLRAATPTPPLSPDSTGPAASEKPGWFDPADDDRDDIIALLKDTNAWQAKRINELLAALTPSAPIAAEKWDCAAKGSVGANDPQECNWPLCGCDPHAEKVVAALQECDLLKSAPIAAFVLGEYSAEKILEHKWLDPECIEKGCQSLVLKRQCAAPVRNDEALTENELKAAEEAVTAEWQAMAKKLRAEHITWPVSPTNWRILRAGWEAIAQRRASVPAPAGDVPGEAQTFQARALALFEGAIGDDPSDLTERRDRFGEEALELQQALGQSRENAHALVDYVFGRPVGEPAQEFGGTQSTLSVLASYAGEDLMRCAEADIARWADPDFITRLRMKRAGRHGRGPLPGATPGEAQTQEGGQ